MTLDSTLTSKPHVKQTKIVLKDNISIKRAVIAIIVPMDVKLVVSKTGTAPNVVMGLSGTGASTIKIQPHVKKT